MAARTQPTKFDLRREATRAELIRLALERFPIKGYSSTSIEDVVRDSTLSRGAYYFHFSSKEELFLACLEARSVRRAGWPRIALDPAIATLDAAIRACYGRFAELDGPNGLDWAMLQADFWQMARLERETTERFRELHRGWLQECADFARHCAERGFIGSAASYDELGEAVMALSQGLSIHHSLYGADLELMPRMMARLLGA